MLTHGKYPSDLENAGCLITVLKLKCISPFRKKRKKFIELEVLTAIFIRHRPMVKTEIENLTY